MDCIRPIHAEHARLDGRPVAPAFHLAVIEDALKFVAARLGSTGPLEPEERRELGAACSDALEALADLRGATP